MADIRQINENISVAPQISPGDVAEIAARGFRTLMNNRPDGESPGQPPSSEIAMQAQAHGLNYIYLPVISGQVTPQNIEDFGKVLKEAKGPILAYCRTGTRCTNLWALAEAGGCATEELIRQAAAAGYDLSGLSPVLDNLASRRKG